MSAIKKACGGKVGDYLQIDNQWASVEIHREHAGRGPRIGWRIRGSEGDLSWHWHAGGAMSRALAILAAYAEGALR